MNLVHNILSPSGKPWVIHPAGQPFVYFEYNLAGDNTKVYSSVANDWERNYTYDWLGRRLTYTEGELAETLTYNGSNLATHTQSWLENGITQSKTTTYHYNAHRLDSVSYDDALTTIYHYDQYGRVDSLYDESGVVCYQYGSMGEITTEYAPLWQNGTLPKYSFNAKELDEETGMYYYEARYYKPPVFTSRDPMMDQKPWLSPYHYCSNNPVGRVDPTGCDDDWYQSEDGTVGWTEGHAATVVDVNGKRYRNIGETYSKQNADGSYSNYYQNVGFKSNKKFNAKDYILKNDLVGKYIGNKSPLSVSSKKELFQASIHHAQNTFTRYAVEGAANMCNGLGTALSGAGMVATTVPGGQVAAGKMVVIGGALSSVGTGINCMLNIVDGDYKQAAVNATSLAVGFGTTKLWKSLNITTNQTNFLRGKSDVQNSTITDIINSGMGKQQQ